MRGRGLLSGGRDGGLTGKFSDRHCFLFYYLVISILTFLNKELVAPFSLAPE